jgi:hypothetical protein
VKQSAFHTNEWLPILGYLTQNIVRYCAKNIVRYDSADWLFLSSRPMWNAWRAGAISRLKLELLKSQTVLPLFPLLITT